MGNDPDRKRDLHRAIQAVSLSLTGAVVVTSIVVNLGGTQAVVIALLALPVVIVTTFVSALRGVKLSEIPSRVAEWLARFRGR